MGDFIYKYVDVVKMKCISKELKIPKKSIDTIIETCLDYAKILDEVIPTIERPYTKLQYEYKSEEIKNIADNFIKQTGYCKECEQSKGVDDVGLSALEIIANRNRRKGD